MWSQGRNCAREKLRNSWMHIYYFQQYFTSFLTLKFYCHFKIQHCHLLEPWINTPWEYQPMGSNRGNARYKEGPFHITYWMRRKGLSKLTFSAQAYRLNFLKKTNTCAFEIGDSCKCSMEAKILDLKRSKNLTSKSGPSLRAIQLHRPRTQITSHFTIFLLFLFLFFLFLTCM